MSHLTLFRLFVYLFLPCSSSIPSFLKDAVKDCGKITNFKWLEHSDTGRFKGAGFITFESPEAAAKVRNTPISTFIYCI